MPKRLFSDKAWSSDKLRSVQPDIFRAEYAWIHALALCDGTFECDPQKVWANCYAPTRQIDGRGGWTVKRVGEMLDEFDRCGLLLRRTDKEGKTWGYWTNGDDCLPPRGEWYKFARGKRFLFMDSLELASSSLKDSSNSAQGVGVGLGLDKGLEEGLDLDRITSTGAASSVKAAMDEVEKERVKGNIGGLKPGEPGYFTRGQYRDRNPKRIHNVLIARAWQRVKGNSAVARYPSKYPESWEGFCDSMDTDIIVPAFELWAAKEGKYMDTQMPIAEFLKVAHIYTAMVRPLNEIKPQVTKKQLDATDLKMKEAFCIDNPGHKVINGEIVKMETTEEPEPGPEALFGPESESESGKC